MPAAIRSFVEVDPPYHRRHRRRCCRVILAPAQEARALHDQCKIYSLDQNISVAVHANTTTAFTDGAQFGMGAEIGISTQKLHARGPMALQELTSYKWIVKGSGQIRE